MAKCPNCLTDVDELTKKLTVRDVFFIIILLIIPGIGWGILILLALLYITKRPNVCPHCGESRLRFKDGELIKYKKGRYNG